MRVRVPVWCFLVVVPPTGAALLVMMGIGGPVKLQPSQHRTTRLRESDKPFGRASRSGRAVDGLRDCAGAVGDGDRGRLRARLAKFPYIESWQGTYPSSSEGSSAVREGGGTRAESGEGSNHLGRVGHVASGRGRRSVVSALMGGGGAGDERGSDSSSSELHCVCFEGW